MKKLKEFKWLEWALFLMFIIQLIVICYFNLCLLKNHMGYDSSWSYLKAALIWREKSLNSPMWTDQTSLFLDSSVILAALLYGITNNLLVSYGISNILIVCLTLLVVYCILKQLNIGRVGVLFSLNMIICPYLSNGFVVQNDLGYFNDMLSGPAFYSLRVLFIMVIIYELMRLKKTNRIDWVGWISLLFCVLAGGSSGVFIIVIILLPCLIYEIELIFIKNDWKQLKRVEVLYPILGCISVIVGKVVAKLAFGIEAIDNSRTWTTLETFWHNVGAVFLGFMKLLEVLPVTDPYVEVLSLEGVRSLFPLFILFFILLGIGFAIRKLSKNLLEQDEKLLLLLTILLINYLTFSLFNVQYGSPVFEERYLISFFMVVTILIAYFIDHMEFTVIFEKCIVFGFFVAIMCNNLVSDYMYVNQTNDMWEIDEIKEVVDSQDAGLVYFWGTDVRIPGRIMRAVDLNHVYKEIDTNGVIHHWGDYLYYEDNAGYKGSTLLIVGRSLENVPKYILDEYTHLCDLDTVSIYRSETNSIDRISGITGDESIDFPNAIAITTQMGEFEGNSFVTDGTEGYVLYGPNSPTPNGIYDFIFDYEVVSSNNQVAANCEIAIDEGAEVLGNDVFDAEKTQIVFSNVQLQEGHTLTYRVWCNAGTIMKIHKITIIKKD